MGLPPVRSDVARASCPCPGMARMAMVLLAGGDARATTGGLESIAGFGGVGSSPRQEAKRITYGSSFHLTFKFWYATLLV